MEFEKIPIYNSKTLFGAFSNAQDTVVDCAVGKTASCRSDGPGSIPSPVQTYN
jgi:hypothetical protein